MQTHDSNEVSALRHELTTAATLCLSVGFLDMTISITSDPAPGRLQSPEATLASLSTTIFATLGVFFVLRLLSLLVFRRDPHHPISVSTGVAVFLGTLFALSSISVGTQGLWIYLPFVMISLLFAAGAFYFIRYNDLPSSLRNIMRAAACALPVVLAETFLLSWLFTYRWTLLSTRIETFAYSLYIVGVLLTFFSFWKAGTGRRAQVLLGLVVLVPASLFALHLVEGRHSTDHSEGHKVQRVILITVDTLRADALSCYGLKGTSTPHMDGIAQESIFFRNAFSSSPWTWPSLVSIMTGTSPLTHGALKYNVDIPKAFPTLAERMEQSGYLTSAFVYNPIIAKKGMSRGFAEYDSYPKPPRDRSMGSALLDRIFPKFYKERISTSELTNKVSGWLTLHSKANFFLWVHYFDPHLPYDPPAEYLPADLQQGDYRRASSDLAKKIREGYRFPDVREREEIRQLYLAEVRYVDASIGRLVDKLKALHIYDDTLLILSSDHGEEFWEHQGFEHGHTLYNELLRVPLIVKLPGSPIKLVVDSMVSTEGVMPMIEELCGIQSSPRLYTSDSLAVLWKTKHEDSGKTLLAAGNTYYEPKVAVIYPPYKFIVSLITGKQELYDIQIDPGEQHSIVEETPKTVEKARILLESEIKEMENRRNRMNIQNETNPIDQETEERLKSLGYIQ